MNKTVKRKEGGKTPRRGAAAEKARSAAGGKRSRAVQRLRGLGAIVLFAIAALLIADQVVFMSPKVPDHDIFYHLRHTSLYLSRGLFMREFPWVTCSVISKFQGDIWYGFHLLLIPITFVSEPSDQIKVAGSFILAICLLLIYLAARHSKLAYPYIWPYMTLLSAAVFIQRLVMARPHVVSAGVAALLLSFLVSGGLWAIFFLSLALTFLHLSFFWLGILIAIVVVSFSFAVERVFHWRRLVATFGGLAVGWLLRPNPIGAAKILNIQLFRLTLEKQKGLEGFGTELSPLIPQALLLLLPFIALWLGFAAVFLVKTLRRRTDLSPQARVFLWSSLALSALFFAMTMLAYQRALDQWDLFAVLFIAAGYTHFLAARRAEGKEPARGNRRQKIITVVGAVALVGLVWGGVYTYKQFIRLLGTRVSRCAAVGEWLQANSQPGDIVFHANWGMFPELFFWDPKNYYIGGMDPIFQFVYDEKLYWEATHLGNNEMGGKTWGTSEEAGAELEDTYTVLRRDFKAAYLVINEGLTPSLYMYASGDPRFIPCFDDRRFAVFKLAESPPANGAQ